MSKGDILVVSGGNIFARPRKAAVCGAGGGWCPGGLVAAGWRGPVISVATPAAASWRGQHGGRFLQQSEMKMMDWQLMSPSDLL